MSDIGRMHEMMAKAIYKDVKVGSAYPMADWKHCVDAARAALTAIEAAGYAIVPTYPTPEMSYATPDDLDGVAVEDIYRAMLSAAPKVMP